MWRLRLDDAAGEHDRIEVLPIERERLGDAEAAPEQHGQEGAVANPGRRAARARGAEGFDIGQCERLGGESAGDLSLHTPSDGPGTGVALS